MKDWNLLPADCIQSESAGQLRDDYKFGVVALLKSLPRVRRDALSKYACGIFVAKAGSGSDRERCLRSRRRGCNITACSKSTIENFILKGHFLRGSDRKLSADSFCYNPSVTFGDSSPCTGEPFGIVLLQIYKPKFIPLESASLTAIFCP